MRDSILREKIEGDQFYPGQQQTYFFIAYAPPVTFNNKITKISFAIFYFQRSFQALMLKAGGYQMPPNSSNRTLSPHL